MYMDQSTPTPPHAPAPPARGAAPACPDNDVHPTQAWTDAFELAEYYRLTTDTEETTMPTTEYLVRTPSGHDYGRDSDKSACIRAAESLGEGATVERLDDYLCRTGDIVHTVR